MDGTHSDLKPTMRVRLRDSVDPSIYGDFACMGNVGWVKDIREDRFGLPEVLIEWDRDHWAWNGIQDCWTFAEHFELVEESMDKGEAARQAAMDFADTLANLFNEVPQEKPKSHAVDITKRFEGVSSMFKQLEEEPEDDHAEAIAAACELLGESEAFIVIGVDSSKRPYAFGHARDSRSEVATEIHLAGIAARAHQEAAIKQLQHLDEEANAS